MQGDDDEPYTPEEKAYFDNRGVAPAASADVQTTGAAEKDAVSSDERVSEGDAQSGRAGSSDGVDAAEPGEVEVDDQGRIRDAKTKRYVPLPILQRERENVKAAKAEANDLRSRYDALQSKILKAFDRQEQTPAAKTAEPPKKIDPREDLIGAIEQERAERERLAEALQNNQRQTQESLQRQESQRIFEASLREERAKAPDYDDAVRHLTDVRGRQLGRIRAFQDETGKPDAEKIARQVAQDAEQIVATAIAAKQSPAGALYEWAQDYGYTPKKADAVAKPSDAARETVEQIAAGQKGARTLGNSGGGAPSGLTIDEFMSMDDDVIYAKKQSDPKFAAEVRRLLGARA